MPLRIATYNCLVGGSARRNGHLARLVRETGADIVLSQESRPAAQPELDGEAQGDLHFWRPVPGVRWGSGVLVRGRPAAEIQVPAFEGWVIGAELDLPRRTRVFSVHCPAGEKGGGYVAVVHRILDALEPMGDGADLVIGGDFNVTVGYRAEGEPLPLKRGVRALLDRLTLDLGLLPCWQAVHPGEPLAQTLRWSAGRSAPYHCDGIFIPRAWQPRLLRCEVLATGEWERLSDHNPVVAELELEAT